MAAIQAPHDSLSTMEDIHGVDVSWLHHSTRDHQHRPEQLPSSHQDQDARPKTPDGPSALPSISAMPSPTSTAVPTTPPQQLKTATKRPALLSRNSSEKNGSLTPPPPDSKNGSRRNSWMSSISSKFSSQSPPAQTTHAQAQGSSSTANGATGSGSSANGALNGIQANAAGSSASLGPYVPQAPKGSFISNAFRRLSSGSQNHVAPKVYPNGGICPRKVMNVDPNRVRCLVPELHDSKLRKVAFCVDVEIASGPRYNDETCVDEKKKVKKDKILGERGEKEAPNHPQAMAEQNDGNGMTADGLEATGNEKDPNSEGTLVKDDRQEGVRKKEKKKRSETERKERKEKKRKKAEENGTIPLEYTRGEEEGDTHTASKNATPRAPDGPTVDPLRIYRRCCQLRESPILKRISDQLSAPQTCAALLPGIVRSLDLTGSRLQMADILTLSDWLAVVPVKKLFLEDADLDDEKVRVILAGLLAAKMPETLRHGVTLQKEDQREDVLDAHTAIRKLVLKNNPKISCEGWKHIALFIYMCRSIMALDVSMIAFPSPRPLPSYRSATATEVPPCNANHEMTDTKEGREMERKDIADIFSKAISERLGGSALQELVLGECALTSASIRKIVDGCIVSGVQRLGLATNDLDREGFEQALRYIRSGVCQGIDLGGNDLRDWISILCTSLTQAGKFPFWALCLQDTGLTPQALKMLLPVLVALPSFRFLDLSHNKALLSNPISLCLLRKYLPQFKELKRIHLKDVDMKPEDAIAIAEILPDCPHIAHVNILENGLISHVAASTDEETQEDAAALYASLTLAAKLSHSLVCIDIDVPSPDTGEVVKALAKQVVAYCLRNIESINEVPELQAAPKEVEIPSILMHFVGNGDGCDKDDENNASAPDQDYIVGGTGLAKALKYCLSHKESDLRRLSLPVNVSKTARNAVQDAEHPSKARAMSKNLLENARNTRARIQPALAREAKARNDAGFRRLLFLDQTLEGMIQRFETEFPETRLQRSNTASTHGTVPNDPPHLSTLSVLDTNTAHGESDEEESFTVRSRHNSDVSLASRYMNREEGRLHRFGHRVRTELFNSSNETASKQDGIEQPINSAPVDEQSLPEHLLSLRNYFFKFSGEEVKEMIEGVGWEKAFDNVVENAAELQKLEKEDPASFGLFRESQIAALKNKNADCARPNEERVSRSSGGGFAVEDEEVDAERC